MVSELALVRDQCLEGRVRGIVQRVRILGPGRRREGEFRGVNGFGVWPWGVSVESGLVVEEDLAIVLRKLVV